MWSSLVSTVSCPTRPGGGAAKMIFISWQSWYLYLEYFSFQGKGSTQELVKQYFNSWSFFLHVRYEINWYCYFSYVFIFMIYSEIENVISLYSRKIIINKFMPPDFCVIITLCTNIHFDTIIILGLPFFSFYYYVYDQIGGFLIVTLKSI